MEQQPMILLSKETIQYTVNNLVTTGAIIAAVALSMWDESFQLVHSEPSRLEL